MALAFGSVRVIVVPAYRPSLRYYRYPQQQNCSVKYL
jgi:hypothetical protein